MHTVDRLGWRGMPDRCHLPFPGDWVLDVPLHAQLNSYACGVTTGYSVVCALGAAGDDHESFVRFYDQMAPCPDMGVSTRRMTQVLARHGVLCEVRHKLRLTDVPEILAAQAILLTAIHNPGSDHDHWVVVYGYNPEREEILLGVNGLPVFNRRRYSYQEFSELWSPSGFGVICRGRMKPQWMK